MNQRPRSGVMTVLRSLKMFWPSVRSSFASAAPHSLILAKLDRVVIKLAGPTLLHFLQGLLTNDVLPLEHPGSPPIYSCILNAQGRYLHDLFIFRTADAGPAVLVDTDSAGKDDLLRLLKRYRLRQKIDIDDVTDSHSVWASWGDGAPVWHRDPRLPELGCRAVSPSSNAMLAPIVGAELASPQEYRLWRVRHGVAEGDSEIPSGEAVPLEYNIAGLNGISFTKGCYVGQELMARTHFKGVVRKRLMPFQVVGQGVSGVVPDADVFEGPECSGRAVGRVRVVEGEHGLALLRLGSALAAAEQEKPLYVAGGAALRPWRPSWWPAHWGKEDDQRGRS